MENPELGQFNYLKDPKNSYQLKVFFYKHVPQRRNYVCYHQRICTALSTMRFTHDQIVCAQFWAPIDFKSASATVLTTRGQPFGHSVYTSKVWSYRTKCLDHNSYVNHNTKVCIGLPARVFLNRFPEWAQDICKYNVVLYPQLNDAMRSNIRGSLAMPVNDGDLCIGVLEIVMITNLKDKCVHEMSEQVCKALEEVSLKSIVQNENINCDISKDYSSIVESIDTAPGSRKAKSRKVACNDITKLLGMPKADAAKICDISENTFTRAHSRYGIDAWPCVRKGIVKSSAHNALELGRAYHTSSNETQQIKQINDLLMQDDDDNIYNYEDDLVHERMDDLIRNDGNEEHDEIPCNPVLLEPYHHKNKRARI